MSRKVMLFISAKDCHAHTWQKDKLSAATHFPDSTEGRRQFATFIQNHRVPVLLLADLVEEDFRRETVPRLRSGERSALIRRKLEQYYRDTPFRQATILPRGKSGRREDDILFSALTNSALISPWLNILLEYEIALAGIYSVASISTSLVKDNSSDHLLLLSWEKHAGLRQSYFESGQLRFSRLASLCENSSLGATARTEVARTHQYLSNLSLLPSESVLNVLIMCHARDRHHIETQLRDTPFIRHQYLDVQEVGQHAGSKNHYADSDATPFFLHLLASHPRRGHYAAAEHTRFLRLSHMRRILYGMSATLATVSMLWLSANAMAGIQLKKESQSIASQAERLSQQTRQIIRSFPDALAPAPEIKAAVLLSRELDKYSPAPPKLLGGLSKTLDDFPNIRINKLAWQTALPDAEDNIPVPTITLDGDLAEFAGNYRSGLDYLKRFRQVLIQHGYNMTSESMLPEVDTQEIISDTTDLDNPDIKFSLKLRLAPV